MFKAYWGLILCRYGIEYVEDPKTFKRIPTCHRTSFDSVIADPDYKAALQYADAAQRMLYEAEAKEIDRLQKEILALSQKEDPYDVFICYKETDDSGRRTPDSVIANDIYHQLTQEGFKVFYAAISLENKLGSAYEPCIFAALNSAKVMLVVGTKEAYFNAVWVKNEWSRYLKLMKTDRSRILIPCYRDMDAYELPEEFAHLQAQDMSKIGFINDVVRGIKKIIAESDDEDKSQFEQSSISVGSLLERVRIFLDVEEWNNALDYCEKVLDLDPQNEEANVFALFAVNHVSSFEKLSEIQTATLQNSNYYKKAFRFASNENKEKLEKCRKQGILNKIKLDYDFAQNAEQYLNVYSLCNQIINFKDAQSFAKKCLNAISSIYMDTIEQTQKHIEQCEKKVQSINWKIEEANNRKLSFQRQIEAENNSPVKRYTKKVLLFTVIACFAVSIILWSKSSNLDTDSIIDSIIVCWVLPAMAFAPILFLEYVILGNREEKSMDEKQRYKQTIISNIQNEVKKQNDYLAEREQIIKEIQAKQKEAISLKQKLISITDHFNKLQQQE